MCLCLFVSVHVSISLCVYICLADDFSFVGICLVSFLLCFKKTVRVIHYFYPLKNPCKMEESLLGILSLENQTSFSYNLRS